jgi:uncharacterized membrane protein
LALYLNPNPPTDSAEEAFFDLLEQVTPPLLPRVLKRERAAAQEAAIVVMAYYFEACDIFEDPNASA